jgi:uncharacterized membrane protein YkoI
MNIGRRIYWVLALVAVLAIAGTAITVTSRLTSAGGSTPSPSDGACDRQDEADDAAEAKDAPDTDAVEEECGSQDEADDSADANEAEDSSNAADANEAEIGSDAKDANEAEDGNEAASANEPAGGDRDGEINDDGAKAASGTLDDGKDLLPQAKITVDAAVAAAQSAAGGSIGEVDLEHYNGKLVFNVDVGDRDVKVDASTGAVLSADKND